MNKASKQIYFHVGLGKTGTTFLQYRAFPKFKGVKYIQRTNFMNAVQIVNNSVESKFFISYECDQQLEKIVSDFAQDFPNTTPIIVLRRHDSWIASQYRRFVKNGHAIPFKKFIDLENDEGFFKIKDLTFYHQIEILEKYFTYKPLLLFYDDLRKNPQAFIKKLADYMGADIDLSKINLSRKHSSYTEKQLKVFYKMSKRFNLVKKRRFNNNLLHFLSRLYFGFIRYSILYLAVLVPSKKKSDTSLISKTDLDNIKNYFETDWQKCIEYAQIKEF